MVDPKKEYELLMRYLQGGTQKREPAAAPEQSYESGWQAPLEPASEAPLSHHAPASTTPPRAFSKRFHFHLPKWQPIAMNRKGRVAVAAAAVFLLSIFLWKGYAFYQLSPDEIYNRLYVPFNATATDSKNNIAQYYATGNYIAATLQAKKQKQLSDDEKLLTGLSYLKRNDYVHAIKLLEPVSNNFKSPYRQQAEFYVALTFLKNEDFDRCIEKMERIAYTPSHLYHERIPASIISDIKMLKWK